MRRALALTVALALGGCGGGASFADWSTTRAHVPSAETAAPRLAIAPLVVVEPEATAPLATLGRDGALSGPGCELVVTEAGVVRERASDAVLLGIDEQDRLLDAAGEERFRIEGARLVRADGKAAALDAGEVRFEGSPALALRVDGATSEPLERTALVVIAALAAACGR